jgi:hypothetical protein
MTVLSPLCPCPWSPLAPRARNASAQPSVSSALFPQEQAWHWVHVLHDCFPSKAILPGKADGSLRPLGRGWQTLGADQVSRAGVLSLLSVQTQWSSLTVLSIPGLPKSSASCHRGVPGSSGDCCLATFSSFCRAHDSSFILTPAVGPHTQVHLQQSDLPPPGRGSCDQTVCLDKDVHPAQPRTRAASVTQAQVPGTGRGCNTRETVLFFLLTFVQNAVFKRMLTCNGFVIIFIYLIIISVRLCRGGGG